MLKQKILKGPKIATKFLGLSLLMALLPLGFFGYVTYSNSIETLKKEVMHRLIAIADNKASRIENYVVEKRKDVAALASTPTIINAMEQFVVIFKEKGTDSAEYSALDKELRPFLTYYNKSFGYYDLFLISHEGDIVFTVIKEDDFGTNLKTGHYKDSELAKVFDRTQTLMKTEVSDFKYYAPSKKPAAFIAAPVIKEKKIIGAVAFQLDNEEAYELMQDYTSLGQTGETLIGTKINNEAVFVNPLRHDPYAAFRRRITIGTKEALPIQEAVKGVNGSGISIDYRGEEILAVWRYLPSPRWGMVVKIDTKEAFAPVVKLRNWSLIIAIITVCTVILIALLIARTISAPVKTLQKGAEIIGSGNLDYKVGTDAKDEIGKLSRTFDKMTESPKVTTVSRDELAKEVTERKRAEEKIKLTAKEWETTFNSIPDMVSVQEKEFKIVRVNKAYADTLKMKPNELIGKPCYEIIHGTKEPWPNCPHKQTLETGKAVVEEFFEPRLNMYLEVSTSPIFDEKGEFAGSVHVSKNISERKQAEEKLKKTLLDLERSNKELQQFAYVASHDLQEPLRAVASYTQLLKRRYKDKLDESANVFMQFAVDGAVRMQTLIDDLLVYSRIGAKGKLFEPTDFHLVLGQATTNLRVAIEENHAKITDDNLPTVMADASHINQLFQNLIGNAIKFRSQETPHIHLSAELKGNEWLFSVRDNGIGIDPQYKEKIFKIFQRLHSIDEYPGTGIGLAICERIVEQHGGKIWAESEVGKYSTFYFTIPVKRGQTL